VAVTAVVFDVGCLARLRSRGLLVGDRVDNDVEPALAAGMVAVHIKRGPWGHLHEAPAEAIEIRGLDELPDALDG
jgi:FMN phosphatase YigB (HAD superfamily)